MSVLVDLFSELDGSPSHWMQKLALQNHEALERKIKRFKSGDMMLAGMPVPAPANNSECKETQHHDSYL